MFRYTRCRPWYWHRTKTDNTRGIKTSSEVVEAIADSVFKEVVEQVDDPCCENCKHNKPESLSICEECDGIDKHEYKVYSEGHPDETDNTLPCCNNCKYNRPYFVKRCIECDGESGHVWEAQ